MLGHLFANETNLVAELTLAETPLVGILQHRTARVVPGHFFPTVSEALTAFQVATGAEWTNAGHITQGGEIIDTRPPRGLPASPRTLRT